MSADRFAIDSHKLHFHPRRVADWLETGDAFPIYMEVSPAGSCNHRCVFCGLDFMGYRPAKLDAALLGDRLEEYGRLGGRSVMFAGEGEPLLHRDIVALARRAKQAGVDVSFTTNATLMGPALARPLVELSSWIKVSLNAGTPATYARIHGTTPRHFGLVLKNLERAVAARRTLGSACVLGAQILLLPENAHEIETLARTVRDIGLDYLVVKPYSQHPQSLTDRFKDVTYAGHEDLGRRLEELNTPDFQVVFRLRTMRKWDEKSRPYERCLALPFWSYLDASGNVWACSVFLGDERFRFGNIHDETLEAIWTGEKRRAFMDWFSREFDPGACRVNCRMDEINRYLWGLTHPPAHVNFI